MFSIILYQPEIPPNTGNIIRLCANTGATLNLIEPLAFELDEPRLKRAGLDYREFADVSVFSDLPTCIDTLRQPRLFALSTRGEKDYSEASFAPGDALVFGPETRGLPQAMLDSLPSSQRLCLPMLKDSRSLNLSNAVAIVVYEAWRQHNFVGRGD